MNFAVKSHACDILSVLGQKHPKKLKICQINYILPVQSWNQSSDASLFVLLCS